MSNGNESAQSRRSRRHTRGTAASEQPETGEQVAEPDTVQQQSAEPESVQQSTEPATGEQVAAERRSRRAADAPVDAPPTQSGERVSQTRARDREALRAYRALAQQLPNTESSAPPSRRQRRLEQTSGQAQQTSPSTATSAVEAGEAANGTEPAVAVDRPVSNLGPVRQGGRRDRRRRSDGSSVETGALATEPTAQADVPTDQAEATEPQPARPDQMTVQQALAARQAIVGQAQEQLEKMTEGRDDDPFTVDLEILAQQKALAERAAVLNSRAQKIQQLSQANEQLKPSANDPTTAHNLSIVSPREFISVPGTPREVAKTIAASVPVRQAQPAARRTTSSDGRSTVLARAEALTHPRADVPGAEDAEPIGARSAHGLEPLDAMTAGLARVKRLYILQYSIVSLGALALITGIMMITGVFN